MKLNANSNTKINHFRIKILITLGILFAINQSFITGNSNNSLDYSDDSNLDNKNPKISEVSGKIHIINNSGWVVFKNAGNCTGNGTYSEPYVIEDLVIDGGGSGSCILIENSDVYFKIANCSVYHSGIPSNSPYSPWSNYFTPGIQLSDVANSQLINNNCSFNRFGISLEICENNSISGNTIINNYGSGIYLTDSHNNTVLGNIANNNWQSGIELWDSHNNTISGNTASNTSDTGIVLFSSDNNIVSGNIVNNRGWSGIELWDSHNNNISGNTVDNNGEAGIWIRYSDNNTVSGNIMNDCGLLLSGNLEMFTSLIIDTTNLVNGKPLYYYSNAVDLELVNFTNAGQVILVNCNDSLISNLNISYTAFAISLFYGYNNNISRNTVSNNDIGIYIYNSYRNTITANTADNNDKAGISLDSSDYNVISGNIANNNGWGIISRDSSNINGWGGIKIYSSDNNKIIGNTINSNFRGIDLDCSDKNIISGNTIMGNDIGIYLLVFDNFCGECISNEIYDNTFSGNGKDIFIIFGSLFYIRLLIIVTIIISSIIAGMIILDKKVFRGGVKHRPLMFGIIALIFDLIGLIYILIFFNAHLVILYAIPFTVLGIIHGLMGYKLRKDASPRLTIVGTLLGTLLFLLVFCA